MEVTVSLPRPGLTYKQVDGQPVCDERGSAGPEVMACRLSVADRPAGTGRSTVPHDGGCAIPNRSAREGMDLSMVGSARLVTGGVDTHLDVNVVAALDRIGGLLGVESFPTTVEGNRQLLGWLRDLGRVARVGVVGVII